MNINLKNIGIIQDSAIEINGLTVITGQNNSGKTTVGKTLYSLIDSVSNLKQKSINDKYNYAIKKIARACEEFPFRSALYRACEDVNNECLNIFFSGESELSIDKNKIDIYLMDLIHELEKLNITEEPFSSALTKYTHHLNNRKSPIFGNFDTQKNNAIIILSEALQQITGDPDLVQYTKQSLNTTLLTEFYGQIQPAALKDAESSIEMYANDELCFKFKIIDNKICDNEDIIFWNAPYKKAFLIDNPYILGEPAFKKPTKYTDDHVSYINESRIMTHDNKLKYLLNYTKPLSIFEAGILDSRYKEIKNKIDSILPGKFAVSDGEQYYVNNDIKLKTSNLATGSKMFSIIKILLERGEIDENTLLILDEPEAHLHPQWQNMFVEIMFLLVKEVGCHILLTTHSSHFMLAVDAYMRKYDASNICNFYQTKYIDNGSFVKYNCVNDSLDLIYKDFVSSLSDMKLLRNQFI